MKLRAARDKDFSDYVALVRRLGIASEAELHEPLAQACGDPQDVTAERERFAADVLVRSRRWRRLACAVQSRLCGLAPVGSDMTRRRWCMDHRPEDIPRSGAFGTWG